MMRLGEIMNVAYVLCALNLLAMTFSAGEVERQSYFLVGNLWLILAVYLGQKNNK